MFFPPHLSLISFPFSLPPFRIIIIFGLPHHARRTFGPSPRESFLSSFWESNDLLPPRRRSIDFSLTPPSLAINTKPGCFRECELCFPFSIQFESFFFSFFPYRRQQNFLVGDAMASRPPLEAEVPFSWPRRAGGKIGMFFSFSFLSFPRRQLGTPAPPFFLLSPFRQNL